MTDPRRPGPWRPVVSKERRKTLITLGVLFLLLCSVVIYQRLLVQKKPVESDVGSHPSAVQPNADTQQPVVQETAKAEPVPQSLRHPFQGERKVLQPFGPGYSAEYKDFRVHPGIDFQAIIGESVLAAAPGKVTSVQEEFADGMTVLIDHGNGLVTRYASLGKALVLKDATVRAGDSIGLVGKPGASRFSLGAHLHFGLLRDGEPVDPVTFFSK